MRRRPHGSSARPFFSYNDLGIRAMSTCDITRSIVVYDGECPFCRTQIERMRGRDKLGRFDFLPRQTPGLDDRFPQLKHGDFDTGMRLILPDGRVHVGADAVYEICRQLPRWRRVTWLYRVPGIHALARRGYAWIAAHRRSLGRTCENDACRASSENIAADRPQR